MKISPLPFIITIMNWTIISSNFSPFHWLLRSRQKSERPSYRTNYVSEYDEEGQIMQMKNIELSINQASPIVILHVANGTVIGYLQKSNYSMSSSSSLSLSKMIGIDFITPLSHPSLYLICTGLGGDCRETIFNTKQYILNSTYEKNIIPSGKKISSFLGSLFQKATVGGSRPYACHAFLCDMRKSSSSSSFIPSVSSSSSSMIRSLSSSIIPITTQHTSSGSVYDISPSGDVQEIYGQVIGRGSKKVLFKGRSSNNININSNDGDKDAYKVLEKEFQYSMSLEDAQCLVKKVMMICTKNMMLLDQEAHRSFDSNNNNNDDDDTTNDIDYTSQITCFVVLPTS